MVLKWKYDRTLNIEYAIGIAGGQAWPSLARPIAVDPIMYMIAYGLLSLNDLMLFQVTVYFD